MCEDAAASVAASTCSASLMHFLTCDLAAATVPIAESITEAVLAFVDELHRIPAQSWSDSAALLSHVDLLLPWLPCNRGLSFKHAPVMGCITKYTGLLQLLHLLFVHSQLTPATAGPSFTKAQALSKFLATIVAVDQMLLKICAPAPQEAQHDSVKPAACSDATCRNLTNCLHATRACFPRLSMAVRATCAAPLHARVVPRACAHASDMCLFAVSQILHENLALAIDIVRKHHDAPQALIVLPGAASCAVGHDQRPHTAGHEAGHEADGDDAWHNAVGLGRDCCDCTAMS